jgi:hypothetical protein
VRWSGVGWGYHFGTAWGIQKIYNDGTATIVFFPVKYSYLFYDFFKE